MVCVPLLWVWRDGGWYGGDASWALELCAVAVGGLCIVVCVRGIEVVFFGFGGIMTEMLGVEVGGLYAFLGMEKMR